MPTPSKSRREFLCSGGSIIGVSLLTLNSPILLAAGRKAQAKMLTAAAYENISAAEAIELGAIADQIIPADETPAASEIGVLYFIDAALGGFMAAGASEFKRGLAKLQQRVKTSYPYSQRFSALSFVQRTEVLTQLEATEAGQDSHFFASVHFLTLAGMFTLPSYGGNRDGAGWDLLGFDHRHVWQPPFGYYDAAVHGQSDENKRAAENKQAGEKHEHA